MLVACWSTKGGAGTTVVAGALALVGARGGPGSLLVDLAGDLPAVLGVPEPAGAGITDWLAAGPGVPPDGLTRLETVAAPGVGLLPLGAAPPPRIDPARGDVLAELLALDERLVVVDCGVLRPPVLPLDEVAASLARAATHSLLVTRACYLALRRAAAAPQRPSGVVLVREAGRALTAADVEAVTGVPVVASVAVDPAVARAVDAGLLTSRLPRGLAHALRRAA